MQDVSLAYDEILFALAIWREARGENYMAKLGVGSVILNRVADPRWPARPAEVILQPKQFSSFNRTDPNAVLFPHPIDESWLDSCRAVFDLMRDTPDPTGGANHYHSYQRGDSRWPAWAIDSKQSARIGAFKFYKL